MLILDVRLLTGKARKHSDRPNKRAVKLVMQRLQNMADELFSVLSALGEVYLDDNELYKYGLNDLIDYFRRLGAIRCQYLCQKTINERLTLSWCKASYPCLVELFI